MSLELANADKEIGPHDDEYDFDDEHEAVAGPVSTFFNRFVTGKNTFVAFVLVPGLLAALYYGFFASKQYVTESRMIVRTIGVSEQFDTSEEREGRSVIGGDSLTQDSYIVANFLESPEIVRSLDERVNLRELFSRSGIDYLSRLPKDASIEKLHSYWSNQVDTYVDGPSGIIVFTVRAFSPDDAVLILETAMDLADRMIARLSERAKLDLVERARRDVEVSLADYQAALDDLRRYQNQTGILDPVSQAQVTSEVIGNLMEERLELAVQLDALEASNITDSAQARQLNRAIEALDRQIVAREDSLAGDTANQSRLSESLVAFSRLETRRAVTEAIYEAAARNLDTAKATAIRRTTFISTFSAPFRPEESKYPERLASWIIFTLGMFTLWVSGTLLWMSVQDHRA